jgi:hypothetical protein
MKSQEPSYDQSTLSLLESAFDATCAELNVAADDHAVRKIISLKILAAATDGERDPGRLKSLAIGAVNGHRNWRGQ